MKSHLNFCMFDHCDLVNVESSVRHHMSITPKPFQWEYCNLKNMLSDIMKTHIQSNHKNVPSTHIIYSLLKYPLKKKDFDYAHSPYDSKFTKCLLRGEGCIHTAPKYFSTVKVVINHQAQYYMNIYTCTLCIKYIPPEKSRSLM